jgi:NHLM bacteriocin system ABC transporter ATP-binding protein
MGGAAEEARPRDPDGQKEVGVLSPAEGPVWPLVDGQVLDLGSNQPLVLEGEGIWFVQRGEVDVFSVRMEGGAPAGVRRHILRVPAGGLLLGVRADHLPSGQRFIGVATHGTRLLHAPRPAPGDLLVRVAGPAAATCGWPALIDGWVRTVCQALCSGRPPKGSLDLQPGLALEVTAPMSAQPREQVAWVHPQGGRCLLVGNEELPLLGQGVVPLAAPAWLTGQPKGRWQVTDTEQILSRGEAWPALDRLGDLLCRRAELLVEEERRASIERAHRLLLARQDTIRRACLKLAAALKPGSSSVPEEELDRLPGQAGSALLACCRMVGAASGVSIKAPPELESGRATRDPFAAIVRSSRLMARRVALRGDWWRRDHGPIVAFGAGDKRPLALLRVNGRYTRYDPTDPSAAQPVDAGAAASLSPFGYALYRPFPETALDVRALLRFGSRGCSRDLTMVAVVALMTTVLGMVPPFATGLLFNTVIPGADRSQLWQMTILLAVCAVANAGFAIARGAGLQRIQQRMGTGVQAAVWDRLMRLPLRFFRPYTAGDLASRAMSIDGIQQVLSGTTITAILGGVLSLANVILMFSYGPAMAWWGLLLLATTVVMTFAGGMLRIGPERTMMKLRAKTSGLVLQLLTSVHKLRVAGAEARAFAQWVARFSEQRRLQFKVRSTSNWLSAFTAAFPLLSMVLIFRAAFPSLDGDGGGLGTGDFLAFNAAFASCLSAVLGTCTALVDALSSVSLYQQAQPILEALPEGSVGRSDPGPLSGDIELHHVVFRYTEDGPPVLRDVSLRVRPGSFVAFVGPSGSGKSTILKLLLGFETPESGAIFYDGQDLRGLDVQEARRQMGVVLQSSRLVPGDIFRNIAGSSNATLDEAWEAARMAGIADDIKAMPMKMHTVIGEQAGTLSGGQRQRLMIARAIVGRPRILLFDEATSALDNATQSIVTQSLERLKATRIAVAHRLSTIARADCIYVIEGGRIVQSGDYQQLINVPGAFAELARRQLA